MMYIAKTSFSALFRKALLSCSDLTYRDRAVDRVRVFILIIRHHCVCDVVFKNGPLKLVVEVAHPTSPLPTVPAVRYLTRTRAPWKREP